MALGVIVLQRSTGATHCVDLVDEQDRGSHRPCLSEQVTYARGAFADVALHELGSRGRDERCVGLAGHGAGQ